MKCSECARRNLDTNTFCIYCGTTLESPARRATRPSGVPKKVMLPPQNIDELISARATRMHQSSAGIHPAAVVGLAIMIGLAGTYYWFFYRDVFQIMAIDYQTTELINGR